MERTSNFCLDLSDSDSNRDTQTTSLGLSAQ